MYRNISAFSKNGEYFAYSSPDGCLKIWETSSSVLKQEYTPSSHLSATCTCLSWRPGFQNLHSHKKSKRLKSGISPATTSVQLIAMGTMTGDVLLYSFSNAEMNSCLVNGHTAAVNDVCWQDGSDLLFTCSSDQYIIQWDIVGAKLKTKWKADKVAVHSMCIINENYLLSSGSCIQWWDIATKTVIKTFSGHATEVFKLLPIDVDRDSSNQYFLSAALGDRVLNVWQLNKENNRGSIASFVSTDEPSSIDAMSNRNEPIYMSVVSKDGSFHFFEHVVNGKSKKPLQPKFKLQIASKSSEHSPKPQLVPVLSANISEGLDSCLIVYGSYLKPAFERIDISDVTSDLFLIRDVVSSTSTVQSDISKIKSVEKGSAVKLLAPGHMANASYSSDSTSKKRKQKDVDIKELPMEERLKALDLGKTPSLPVEEESAIKSDSMVHLLLQGLQSKDNNLLNTVLNNGDANIIYNTVQRLPLPSVSLVFKELYVRLTKQQPKNRPGMKWLNALLSVHLQYLVSCKGTEEFIAPISQLLEASIENFSKLSQLRGCLKILMSQALTNSSKAVHSVSKPLLTYQSESSESEDSEGVESGSSENEVAEESEIGETETSDSESDMEP